MFVKRSGFSMAYIYPYVYAVGGYNESRQLKCCEKFKLNTDSWEKIADMNHRR